MELAVYLDGELCGTVEQAQGLGSEAEHIVHSMRTGVVDAFAAAVEALDNSSPEVREVVDDLMSGIKQMPLVASVA
jgi:hypothetical protein